LSETVARVPRGVDVERVKRRIEAILSFMISGELDEFIRIHWRSMLSYAFRRRAFETS